MAYFSNGTEGEMYEERYCRRCLHHGPPDGPGCPVFLLHLTHNYDECNKEDSFLHTLIPRSKGGLGNEQCSMFINKGGLLSEDETEQLPLRLSVL